MNGGSDWHCSIKNFQFWTNVSLYLGNDSDRHIDAMENYLEVAYKL